MEERLRIGGHAKLGEAFIKFCGFGLIASSILKFVQPPKVVAYLGFLGFKDDKYFFIASIEIVLAILFLIRRTRPFGLLLVSSYLGGAISAHLASHSPVAGGPFLMFTANHRYLSTLPPNVFLLTAWFGVWLSKPDMVPSANRETTDSSRSKENPLASLETRRTR